MSMFAPIVPAPLPPSPLEAPHHEHGHRLIRQVRSDRQRVQYHLEVTQQPKQARMCGTGEKADRRPLDPPPIIQLRIEDSTGQDVTSPTVAGTRRHQAASLTQSPYFFCFASLCFAGSDQELYVLNPENKTRYVTGTVVSSLYHMRDGTSNPHDSVYFVFPDINIRVEGTFRFKMSMYEIVGSEVHHCKSIWTNSFVVYSAKRFPGMEGSTELSKAFAEQGIHIRIRKPATKRKTASTGSDSQEEGSSDEPFLRCGPNGKVLGRGPKARKASQSAAAATRERSVSTPARSPRSAEQLAHVPSQPLANRAVYPSQRNSSPGSSELPDAALSARGMPGTVSKSNLSAQASLQGVYVSEHRHEPHHATSLPTFSVNVPPPMSTRYASSLDQRRSSLVDANGRYSVSPGMSSYTSMQTARPDLYDHDAQHVISRSPREELPFAYSPGFSHAPLQPYHESPMAPQHVPRHYEQSPPRVASDRPALTYDQLLQSPPGGFYHQDPRYHRNSSNHQAQEHYERSQTGHWRRPGCDQHHHAA
ncbi:uncharacterized protein L969DRAFT_88216 [Mixia osmundae IAM 14324]|uniref:Velvet domain-containing protein n=1 Tax=Mixia osmundae (strain CBS 9802 / IAM 14324 / JCM 22182 / KY 12970) TaxID=764103 RepID=G7E0Z0_MIXOS|nr:uncharacterized protein L969DRAFT_88216 [Mixia osmundae IAM 14324]KEI38865.1 hypothetical protein L969DRAFT_88216 [Mixia osmundae IAM 14324]GAA96500.1 hypothetical protein E5Q_03168 [Mixia osmundae IAM 14324]